MALNDFTDCIRSTLGDSADSWDDSTAAALIELADWFQAQEATIQSIFDEIVRASGSAARAWLSAVVTSGAEDDVLAVVHQLGSGVGMAPALSAVAECASER